jgi:hypothetical protein
VPIEGGGTAACHLHAHGPKLGGHSLRPFLHEHRMRAIAAE